MLIIAKLKSSLKGTKPLITEAVILLGIMSKEMVSFIYEHFGYSNKGFPDIERLFWQFCQR